MVKREEVAKVIEKLFATFMNEPELMRGARWVDGLELLTEGARARHVGDYLAGMTDTYALDIHKRLMGS